MNEGTFVPGQIQLQNGAMISIRFNPRMPDRIYYDGYPGNEDPESAGTQIITAQSTDQVGMFIWRTSAEWRAQILADSASRGNYEHSPMDQNPHHGIPTDDPTEESEAQFYQSRGTPPGPAATNPYAVPSPNGNPYGVNPNGDSGMTEPLTPNPNPNGSHFSPPTPRAPDEPLVRQSDLNAEVALNQYRTGLELFDIMLKRHLPEDSADHEMIAKMKERIDIVNHQYEIPPIWEAPLIDDLPESHIPEELVKGVNA